MSAKPTSASGGVRNLRAMFENKDESTSPPDRGRSPGTSVGASSAGTSPRPLSKVRTSFVTVENKGGQWGLRRDTSGEPSMTKRRKSFSIDEQEHPKTTAIRKESLATEIQARNNSTVIEETIPESAIETPSMEVDKQLGAAPAKEEPLIKSLAKGNANKSEEPESKKSTSPTSAKANGRTPTPAKSKESAMETEEKPAAASNAVEPGSISATNGAAVKTSPKAARPVAVAKSPKTPTPTSPLTGPSDPSPSADPVKPASPEKGTELRKSPPAKLRIQPSPPRTGFVKPKPKSPTRPVKLPPSLTAHTASSGSKTANSDASPPTRQSLSRASGNVQPPGAKAKVTKSPSRATDAKVLTRKSSTLKSASTRPSLGPPPSNLKKQPSKQHLPQKEAPQADDSFLARMMRPTASSASKTAEKGPDTPPKRSQSVKRPATKETSPATKEALKPATKVPKSATPVKTTMKETAKKILPSKTKESSTSPKSSGARPASSTVKKAEPTKPKETTAKELKKSKSGTAKVVEAEVGKAAVVEQTTEKAPIEEKEVIEEAKVGENKIEVPVADGMKTEEPKKEGAEDPFVEEPKIEEVSKEPEDKDSVVEESQPVEVKAEEPEDLETKREFEPIQVKADEPEVEMKAGEPEQEAVESPEVREESKINEEVAPTKNDMPAVQSSAPNSPVAAEKTALESSVAGSETIESAEKKELKEAHGSEDTASLQENSLEKQTDVVPASPKVEESEDPEDVRAREEIARLNAEIMGVSPVSEDVKIKS